MFLTLDLHMIRKILIESNHCENKNKRLNVSCTAFEMVKSFTAVSNISINNLYYTATLVGISHCQHETKCSNPQAEGLRRSSRKVIYVAKIRN